MKLAELSNAYSFGNRAQYAILKKQCSIYFKINFKNRKKSVSILISITAFKIKCLIFNIQILFKYSLFRDF